MPFLFEDFALDTDRRELRRGTDLIPVGPKVFDLLLHLLQNRDHVVSKEQLLDAVWAGRIVSDSTLTSCLNAVRKAISDTGSQQRLIRTVSRKGLRFVGDVREENVVSATGVAPLQRPLSLPDMPSIAVLPFTNMSGDPQQEYFADGFTEDIITELSRMRWLFVIARNSTFTYKGRTVDLKQVASELGVRYVLQGSVRHTPDRVRITAQLVNTETGAHLWADRFDGALADIFDLQDKLASSTIGAIAPRLEQAEIERAQRKHTDNLNAYDYFLRGMAKFHEWSKDANSEALQLFKKAIELDPTFASAYGMAAWCYNQRETNRWMTDRAEVDEATHLARRAIELGRDDAVALSSAGYALARLGKDCETGVIFIGRARTLNPNLASALYFSGWVRTYLGDLDAAIEEFTHVMRLSPLDPLTFMMQTGVAFAHFFAGRYDDASVWAEHALRERPMCHPALRIAAASYALSGHQDRASALIGRLLDIDPGLRMPDLKNLTPVHHPKDMARYEDGLRKAGLPL